MFQTIKEQLLASYAEEGEVYEVEEYISYGVEVIEYEELYLDGIKVGRVEGMIPRIIFDGGVMLHDDHLSWFVFDDKPTITMEQAKSLSGLFGAGENETEDGSNPEDCTTWYWQDDQDRY